ncbi:MAG: 3-dehydroquinate synthase [Planctomycetota bacterium]
MPDDAPAHSSHDTSEAPHGAVPHAADRGFRAFDATIAPAAPHRVRFTRGALDPANPTLRDLLAIDPHARARRMVVVADEGFVAATPSFERDLRAYAAAHSETFPAIVSFETAPGGEAAKESMAVADRVNELVERHAIDRKSFVLAAGGGALLDAAGFGAATAHRGVRLVRFATTVLAQDDAAMGVKNGVNRFGKKNFTGAFAVPFAVVCDESWLETLPPAVFRAGFSEAVKIALLKDPAFFARIERDATRIARGDLAAATPVVRRSAELHLRHIVDGGDPFETGEARPLDFGHWAAHRLESMSAHAVSHGDAVALGLLLDCGYARLAGWLDEATHARIAATITALGLPTRHPLLADTARLLAGIEEFREHLGGTLHVTMLRAIGEGFEVHALDPALVARAAAALA